MRNEDGSDLVSMFLGGSTALGGGSAALRGGSAALGGGSAALGGESAALGVRARLGGINVCICVFGLSEVHFHSTPQRIVPRRARRGEDDSTHFLFTCCLYLCLLCVAPPARASS